MKNSISQQKQSSLFLTSSSNENIFSSIGVHVRYFHYTILLILHYTSYQFVSLELDTLIYLIGQYNCQHSKIWSFYKISWLFPDFFQNFKFPWLNSKFPDFSLTLVFFHFSLTFPWPWESWDWEPSYLTNILSTKTTTNI